MTNMSPLIVLLLILGTSIALPDVDKRGLLHFSSMVERYLGHGFDYVGYGCYCGVGGQGTPVDGLDRCCQAHDQCWGAFDNNDPCRKWYHNDKFSESYFRRYKYTIDRDGGTITCEEGDHPCRKQLCECDKEAVLCFAKNQIDPKYKHYRFWHGKC